MRKLLLLQGRTLSDRVANRFRSDGGQTVTSCARNEICHFESLMEFDQNLNRNLA